MPRYFPNKVWNCFHEFCLAKALQTCETTGTDATLLFITSVSRWSNKLHTCLIENYCSFFLYIITSVSFSKSTKLCTLHISLSSPNFLTFRWPWILCHVPSPEKMLMLCSRVLQCTIRWNNFWESIFIYWVFSIHSLILISSYCQKSICTKICILLEKGIHSVVHSHSVAYLKNIRK